MKKRLSKVIHKKILAKTAIFSILFLILLFNGGVVLGQSNCQPGEICNPLGSNTFEALIQDIAKIVVKIGIPLVVVFIVYSGFLFVTASGNEEKMTKAKDNFFWAMLGAAIVIGAYAIATAIVEFAKTL